MRESVNIRGDKLIVFSKSVGVQSFVPPVLPFRRRLPHAAEQFLTRMAPMDEWLESIEKNSRHSLLRDIHVEKFLTLSFAYKPIEELY
jgi:hypothetical protein